MQELMSRHKAYGLNPRDCLKTTLFQKWQRMVAPPGECGTNDDDLGDPRRRRSLYKYTRTVTGQAGLMWCWCVTALSSSLFLWTCVQLNSIQLQPEVHDSNKWWHITYPQQHFVEVGTSGIYRRFYTISVMSCWICHKHGKLQQLIILLKEWEISALTFYQYFPFIINSNSQCLHWDLLKAWKNSFSFKSSSRISDGRKTCMLIMALCKGGYLLTGLLRGKGLFRPQSSSYATKMWYQTWPNQSVSHHNQNFLPEKIAVGSNPWGVQIFTA